MATVRNAVFLRSLSDLQLLEGGQLQELTQHPLARGDDLPALGRHILQKGWLTRFQINLVAQGKAKDLILGPYRLLDRLGEGGMGQVFKAHHQVMNRLVALKVIRPERLANATAVQRFFREVQAAARLVHPNIVLAFDAGQVDKNYYFAMEYIEGADLARLVKEAGRLPVAAACDYVRQAALGLQHAFEQGLVHRDIKPSNLILARPAVANEKSAASVTLNAGPVVKILDMGLARLGSGEGMMGLTQDGAVIGTPDYIAPEQALDARSADIRSDLYSLGGTLYFLLAGRPPFQGGTLTEMLLKHQMESPPPLETLCPDVPAEVAGIVNRLLAKGPEKRYQTPIELAQVLTAVSQGGAALVAAAGAFPARPEAANDWADLTTDALDRPAPRKPGQSLDGQTLASPRGRPARPGADDARKKKLLLAGAGGLAALALLIVGLIVLQSGPDRTQAGAGGTSRPPADTAVAVVQVPPTFLAPRPPLPPDPGPRPMPDPGPRPPNPPVPPVAAAPAGGGELWQLQSPVTLTKLSVSPDGKQAVTCTASSKVAVWDLEKPGLVGLVNASSMETYAVAALPDRGKTLVGQPLGVGLLDVDAGRVIRPLRGDAASTCYAMAASADGRQVVVGGGTTARKDCHARLFDVATGQQVARSDELPSSVTKVTRSADGRRALLQCSNQLFVWDVDKPAVRKLVQVSGQLRDAVLMPDGRKALMCFSGIACLWDVDADQQAQEIARFPSIDRVAVSPDGKFGLLLCSGNRMPPKAPDQSLQLVDLASGQKVRALENIPNHIRDVAFMGDAKRAVSIGTDRTLRAWDLNPAPPPGNPAPANPAPSNPPPATGKELWRLDTPLGMLARLAVSPDGQHLLVTLSGHALLVDAATGKVVRRLDGPLGAYQWVAFLPDNKRALIVSNSRLVLLWDLEKGQILREDAIPGAEGLALTPDGRRYFVGGRDRVLLALDVETGKELLRLEGHRSQVRTVSASPDGRWVLSTGEIDFLWWDPETGNELGRGQGAGFVRGAAIAPDSRRFALGNQNTIRIWDREAGKEIGQLAALASDAMSIAWLPDGRHLVAASGTSSLVNGKPVYRDSVVRQFDVQAARLLATFAGHDKHAWDLRVSPDGRRAYSSYMDSTVRCWDLEAALKSEAGK